MENKYANLRIDNKDQLPEPWYNYPVLQPRQFQAVLIYSQNKEYIKIHVGMQDGVWTVGSSIWVPSIGDGGHYPGRKWGEFASRDDAILYQLGDIHADLKKATKRNPAAIRAVEEEIKKTRFDKLQSSLF